MEFERAKGWEIKKAVENGAVAVLPVGSTEQHGPHLPTGVDTMISKHICVKACEMSNAVCLPAVSVGYDEMELSFPGVLSATNESLIGYVFDICVSATKNGFKKLLLVNGHGRNSFLFVVNHMVNERTAATCATVAYSALIRDVVQQVRQSEFPGGVCHSCEVETSLALHLFPELVDMSRAVKEIPPKHTKYIWYDSASPPPVFIHQRFNELTASGVIGDPTVATREKGKLFAEAAISRLAELISTFQTGI